MYLKEETQLVTTGTAGCDMSNALRRENNIFTCQRIFGNGKLDAVLFTNT
jgi:hypothetical protein